MRKAVQERLAEKGPMPEKTHGPRPYGTPMRGAWPDSPNQALQAIDEHVAEVAEPMPNSEEAWEVWPSERVLTDGDFAAFSAALGLNIQTKEELLKRVKLMTTVSVEGTEITLDPRLLNRLKSRCIHRDFPGFLRETVRKQLFDFAAF